MSKLIIEKYFSQVPNDLNNSSEISLKAKGLYSYLNGKPHDWDFAAKRIAHEIKESEGCIKSTLRELEKNGYLERHKYQDDKGHFGINYILKQIPTVKKPTSENPISENPTTGKVSDKERNTITKKYTTKKEGKRRTNFKKPTIEDVFLYLTENKSKEKSFAKKESDKFWNYYESKGWYVGRNKMKNWKSAATNWINRSEEFKDASGNNKAKLEETEIYRNQ